MDCSSASAAERVCDRGEGVQCPKERKPIFFMAMPPADVPGPNQPGCRRTPPSPPGGQLVLRLRREVAGVVALAQLARRLAGDAVDHAPAPDRRPLEEGV